jgi:anti-sigma regulatory factor (Ser/Thr protein kinase)
MTAEPGMHHDALLYAGDVEFAHGVGAFVRQGVEAGEHTVVVEPPRQIELLRDELGTDARHVEFVDMTQVGMNPARIIAVWKELLHTSRRRGVRLRGVGEPAFVGRSDDELDECRIHEHLLNTAFGGIGPTWNLLCPYDRAGLPAAVIVAAGGTHPCLIEKDEHRESSRFTDDLNEVFGGMLSRVPVWAQRRAFGDGEISQVRADVWDFGRTVGLDDPQAADLVLVASELATNSIRYGGGGGTLSMWVADGAVHIEVTDSGLLREPLVGRLRPGPDWPGGRGLYLVNQVCDLVQIRSGADGTRVRAMMRRAPADYGVPAA